jgi:hypothetical protein
LTFSRWLDTAAKPTGVGENGEALLPLRDELPEAASAELGEQLRELQAAAQRKPDDQSAAALRWLLHQPDLNPTLRNEAGKVLLAWKPEWLARDLAAMARDPAQPLLWRLYAVQHLAEHFSRNGSVPAREVVEALASGGPMGAGISVEEAAATRAQDAGVLS